MKDKEIIAIYKPVGLSSFDVIRRFKQESGFVGKVDHGGTLDPFACGVLLLLLNKGTKQFDEIKNWKKIYTVGIRFGAISSTQDVSGVIKMDDEGKISIAKLTEIISEISNKEIEQKVSPFSAAKHNGVPLYKLAKKGIVIEKKKEIYLGKIEKISYRYPLLTLKVECARGAYMRQLAEDIGEKLKCKCFVYFLEREQVGKYNIRNCYKIDKLNTIIKK